MAKDFPSETPTVVVGEFLRRGLLYRVEYDMGLYYFPGDYIAGDSFEAWLSLYEVADTKSLAEALQKRGFRVRPAER